MSSLSHTIRKFNRFELEYLIALQQVEPCKSALCAYLAPDEHGDNNGRYALSSLYYDSVDFRCYWEKVDGVKLRRKLRIRHYETDEPLTQDTPVYIVIKQRMNRVIQKRPARLPCGAALRLCSNRQIPDHAPEDRAIIEEIYAFLWQYNLRLASIVRYRRQVFVGTEYDIGLRVTLTPSWQARLIKLHLHGPPSDLSYARSRLGCDGDQGQ